MTVLKTTHTGPQRFESGKPQVNVTYVLPDTSVYYVLSAEDYADFKLMLADWRAQRESR